MRIVLSGKIREGIYSKLIGSSASF